MPTAHAYLRVSTGKQGALGLDAQKKICQDLWQSHLKKDYPEIVYYADEDVSARAIEFKKRPKAKELGLRLQKGDCIIFPKLDRGFRSLQDTLNMFDYWQKLGVRICCPDFGIGQVFDSTSLMGKMLIVMLGLCAEIEGMRSKQRMADWSASQAKMGRATSGTAPYGFKFIRHGEKTGAKNQSPAVVQPHEAEQKILRFCDEYRDKGFGYTRIAKHLARAGFMNRSGRPWCALTLSHVHKKWRKVVVPKEAALQAARRHGLKSWEFISPNGILCQRIEEKPRERDQLLPHAQLGEDEQVPLRDGG